MTPFQKFILALENECRTSCTGAEAVAIRAVIRAAKVAAEEDAEPWYCQCGRINQQSDVRCTSCGRTGMYDHRGRIVAPAPDARDVLPNLGFMPSRDKRKTQGEFVAGLIEDYCRTFEDRYTQWGREDLEEAKRELAAGLDQAFVEMIPRTLEDLT